MLEEITLFERLKSAYESTTRKNNYFQEAIRGIQWDEIFTEDGEIYFCKDEFTLILDNLNPFEERGTPTVLFRNEIVSLTLER